MPDRRLVLAAGLSLVAGPALAVGSACGSGLLTQAMARMGGPALLSRVKALRWTGKAKIFAGERTLEIATHTLVRPFQAARSDTWLTDEGPSGTRSLIIEGAEGFMERSGKRAPMPAAMLAHERQQYALYGLMLLAPLCAPDVETWLAAEADGSGRIEIAHPQAPRTTLIFDPGARLVGARNRVVSPDDGVTEIAQDFAFSGEIEGGGLRWPRGMTIRQNDAPYFELALETFTAEV